MIKETLPYSRYEIKREVPSRIDPTYIMTVIDGIRCPSCKREQVQLEHGERIVCRCGLEMTLYGNSLECIKR